MIVFLDLFTPPICGFYNACYAKWLVNSLLDVDAISVDT